MAEPRKPQSKTEATVATSPNVIGEVKEMLEFLPFDENMARHPVKTDSVVLPSEVMSQLENFVATIASLYNDTNDFHNFEHAMHVTQSTAKFLSRIFHPVNSSKGYQPGVSPAFQLHQQSCGITSDPLIQFACVLSALIHDIEHTGVANATLVKENHPLARQYEGRSVAEQHSLDVAWQVLMNPAFKDLRSFIYTNEEELQRFRSTLVTLVVATDIADRDLGASRKARWEAAFSGNNSGEEGPQVAANRKATVVLEHLIQASDVSHTMQHWQVFSMWNKKLFFEMYRAFLDGRTDKDPSESWFEGEIGFFDFYIIPLAKKLGDCGVFGLSGEECLTNARANRMEWEQKGRGIVKDYVTSFEAHMNGLESGHSIGLV